MFSKKFQERAKISILFGSEWSVLTPKEMVPHTQWMSERIFPNASSHSVELRQIANSGQESNYLLPVNSLGITLTALIEINTKIYTGRTMY
jgi:hypothetical protein